jgi:hypothetical protein
MTIVSKGEFARMINVSPGRVAQYITGGKLSGSALVGAGRQQRVDVEIAKEQLRERLDAGQMQGNGRNNAAFRPESDALPDAFFYQLTDAIADHFHLQKHEVARLLARELARLPELKNKRDAPRA